MSSSQASSLFKDNSILSSEIDLDLATVPILKQNFEKCVKCLKSVNPVTETSVNFSSGLYHTDCFCCSKCSQIIDCENQVIVLSDENEALCADCSLKCKSCKRPILEDAVTTGESTYHPACFNCDTCGEKISSLTFAFVEDKLMCTSCHNEINQLSSSINSESSIQVIKKLASQNKILSKSLEKLENINITLEASQIEVESELSLIKKDLAKETARRVQAELMVNKLQTELARYQPGDSNDCLNQNTEEVAMKTTFIKLEIDDLNEQKTSLQNQLEEIKKEMLNQDIKAVYASNDDLENIKDTFHLEIAQLKADKSALKVDITRLVEKKIELMKELDRLRDKKPEAKKPAKVIVLTPGKSSAENLATPPAADTSPLSVSSNSVTLNLENANLDKQPKVEKEKKVGGWTQMLATATTSSPKTKSKDVAKSVITKSENDLQNASKKVIHSFQAHNYIRPLKCDACHETLWGKEQRCEDCGFHVHTKCINQAPQNCNGNTSSPTLPQTQVFGTPLKKLLETENQTIPNIVKKCIAEVESRGMDFEGIYRKSGPLTQINKMISQVNKGEEIDFGVGEAQIDIMAVTSVLKQYFRDLPIPVITFDTYEEFMNASRSEILEQDKTKLFQDALAKLPQCHLDTLTYLLKHLYRVTIQSPVNLMHSGNIGVVFGPTLMRPGGDTSALTDIAESGTKSYCIEFMVRNCQLLFEKDEVIVSPVQVEKIAEPIAEPVDAIQVE